MTQAPTHEKPSGNDRRLGFGTEARGNGCVESPEEGGHSEAPPAYVSFGISEQGAEQAEWDSASERDIPSPSRHRARRTLAEYTNMASRSDGKKLSRRIDNNRKVKENFLQPPLLSISNPPSLVALLVIQLHCW
ncbi:synaptopodin-2 isoform X2 [Esox lucius]|uniref:synaptopodin-2 isoform X2 n=1 Tax=Esox lucius TaxID=8010 RepID=UPI001476F782|nr:synaptopodin-2 isoform X2 [Esox lucius]